MLQREPDHVPRDLGRGPGSHCPPKGLQFNHFPGLKRSSPISTMGITSPAGNHSLADSGERSREREGRQQLGQEAESKARIREQWQIPKPDWRKHSSPGPPAPQGGLPGLAFPGSHLVEGQDPVGQAELRKVKRAVSDSSPASGSRGWDWWFLNFLEPSLAQRLNDKPEHGYT